MYIKVVVMWYPESRQRVFCGFFFLSSSAEIVNTSSSYESQISCWSVGGIPSVFFEQVAPNRALTAYYTDYIIYNIVSGNGGACWRQWW